MGGGEDREGWEWGWGREDGNLSKTDLLSRTRKAVTIQKTPGWGRGRKRRRAR